MLCEELQWYGPGPFQRQLDQAYGDFISFCKARKIPHSQPPWTTKLESWHDSQMIEDSLFSNILIFEHSAK